MDNSTDSQINSMEIQVKDICLKIINNMVI